jgi:hypothetical protein
MLCLGELAVIRADFTTTVYLRGVTMPSPAGTWLKVMERIIGIFDGVAICP